MGLKHVAQPRAWMNKCFYVKNKNIVYALWNILSDILVRNHRHKQRKCGCIGIFYSFKNSMIYIYSFNNN